MCKRAGKFYVIPLPSLSCSHDVHGEEEPLDDRDFHSMIVPYPTSVVGLLLDMMYGSNGLYVSASSSPPSPAMIA